MLSAPARRPRGPGPAVVGARADIDDADGDAGRSRTDVRSRRGPGARRETRSREARSIISISRWLEGRHSAARILRFEAAGSAVPARVSTASAYRANTPPSRKPRRALVEERALLDRTECLSITATGVDTPARNAVMISRCSLTAQSAEWGRPYSARMSEQRDTTRRDSAATGVARHVGQPGVEFAGKPYGDRRIVRAAGGLLLAHMALELGAELRAPAGDDETDDLAFERTADTEHVLRLVERRPCRRRGATWMRIDQPFGLQERERGPDERAAHAESRAQLILGELGAGRQRLLDDRLAQRLARELDTRTSCSSTRTREHFAYDKSKCGTQDAEILAVTPELSAADRPKFALRMDRAIENNCSAAWAGT